MSQRSTGRRGVVSAVLLPLLAAGCGGTGDSGSGLFGANGTSTLGGTPPVSGASVPSAASGSLQPNAAPRAAPMGTTTASGVVAQTTTPVNGSLAPMSGTYAGTWATVQTPTSAESGHTQGGTVTLKLAYPAHPAKTVLGDVSGMWADTAFKSPGRITGTIDRIGLTDQKNAVHVVGSIQFPGGKSRPWVVELSEDAVGHLAGATATDTVSLKKSR